MSFIVNDIARKLNTELFLIVKDISYVYRKDISPLNAILVEYILRIEVIGLFNYSAKYADGICRVLINLHLHGFGCYRKNGFIASRKLYIYY